MNVKQDGEKKKIRGSWQERKRDTEIAAILSISSSNATMKEEPPKDHQNKHF